MTLTLTKVETQVKNNESNNRIHKLLKHHEAKILSRFFNILSLDIWMASSETINRSLTETKISSQTPSVRWRLHHERRKAPGVKLMVVKHSGPLCNDLWRAVSTLGYTGTTLHQPEALFLMVNIANAFWCHKMAMCQLTTPPLWPTLPSVHRQAHLIVH